MVRPRRRRIVLYCVALVGLPLAVIAALAALDLLRIHRQISAAKDELLDIETAELRTGSGVVAAVRRTTDEFHRADHRARNSRWLGLVGSLPVVGGQVDRIETFTGAAAELGDVALASAKRIAPQFDAASTGPAGRVALLNTVADEIDTLRENLAAVDLGGGDLLPPLSWAKADFEDDRRKALDELAVSRRQVAALAKFFDEPSRYFVIAANNAEMGAGAGMPEAGGVATIEGGDIAVEPFISLDKIWLGNNSPIDPPGQLLDLYWRLGIGADFRGSMATPNWPVSGKMTVDMLAVSKIGPVDGILVVDPLALREMMVATGIVVVDGKTYSQRNIADILLNENYITFDSIDQRDERQEAQSRVALAIFDALRTRRIAPGKLLHGLAAAVKGRHLMAYSSDPELQWLWHSIGADGSLAPDGLMVSMANFDANKLDYHLKPLANLRFRRAEDGSWDVRLAVAVYNTKEYADSAYVTGIDPLVHNVFLDLHLPYGAYDVRLVQGPTLEPLSTGVDPPMKVATTIYSVPVGKVTTVVVGFSLPGAQRELTLLPSARTHPLRMRVGPRLYDDAEARTIVIPTTCRP